MLIQNHVRRVDTVPPPLKWVLSLSPNVQQANLALVQVNLVRTNVTHVRLENIVLMQVSPNRLANVKLDSFVILLIRPDRIPKIKFANQVKYVPMDNLRQIVLLEPTVISRVVSTPTMIASNVLLEKFALLRDLVPLMATVQSTSIVMATVTSNNVLVPSMNINIVRSKVTYRNSAKTEHTKILSTPALIHLEWMHVKNVLLEHDVIPKKTIFTLNHVNRVTIVPLELVDWVSLVDTVLTILLIAAPMKLHVLHVVRVNTVLVLLKLQKLVIVLLDTSVLKVKHHRSHH